MSSILKFVFAGVALILILAAIVGGCGDNTKFETKPGTPSITSRSDIEIVSNNPKNGDYGQTFVYADVKNNTDKLCQVVTLQVVYKDSTGKTVGTGAGVLNNLPAGETRTVECIAVNIQGATKYTVAVETALFE